MPRPSSAAGTIRAAGVAFAALAALGAARLVGLALAVRRGRRLSRTAVAYERRRPAGASLLVVGDSLAVGVGARAPAASVPGRIAAACPAVAIVNRARSGARLADVPAQLAGAGGGRWDAVLVAIGGNDVLRGTRPARAAHDARHAIAQARRRSTRVVVASSANVGAVPAVPWPLDRLLQARTRRVRDTLADACSAHGAAFVDFYRPIGIDPFSRAPHRYFGADGLHPSDAAYALCFAVIERRTGLVAALAAIAAAAEKKRPA